MDYHLHDSSADRDDNTADDCHPSGEERPTGMTPHAQPQSRCTDQSGQSLLTWNISLTDDQDEISENFLMMHDEPSKVAEQFGPDILKIPAHIRKEADEMFKVSEIDSNEKCNFGRDSWILPSSYQQYIKSIPPTVLEKNERHVLYPWTLWNESMDTPHRRPGNTAIASPSEFDCSCLPSSTPIQPQHAYALFPRSSNNNNNNNGSVISSSSSSSSFGNSDNSSTVSVNNSDIGSGGNNNITGNSNDSMHWLKELMSGPPPPSPQQRSELYERGGAQRPMGDRSVSSADSYRDRLMRPMVSMSQPSSSVSQPQSSVSPPSNGEHYRLNIVNLPNYCAFCYKNQELPEVYGSHQLRIANRITCPKLRAIRCRYCKATGNRAHTTSYCPLLKFEKQ